MALSATFVLFCLGAALIAYPLLRDASAFCKMALLTAVAGLLSVAAVEDLVKEVHEAEIDNSNSLPASTGGFALLP